MKFQKYAIFLIVTIVLFGGIKMTEASGGPHGRTRHYKMTCYTQDDLQVINNAAQYHRGRWDGWKKQANRASFLMRRHGDYTGADLMLDTKLYPGKRGESLAFAVFRRAFKHRCNNGKN